MTNSIWCSTSTVVLPLSRSFDSLTVLMFDPLDLILIDNLKKITGCEINPVVATKKDILKAIDQFYGKEKIFRDAMQAAGDFTEDGVKGKFSEETDLSLDKLIAQAEEAPVVKLVDLMIITPPNSAYFQAFMTIGAGRADFKFVSDTYDFKSEKRSFSSSV